MYVVLLAFGLVLVAAGIALIVFGTSITTANLGSALVTAGTIVSIGSLGLIGLSSAVRQLRRIAQVLESRPLGASAPEATETVQRIHPPVLTPSVPAPSVPAPSALTAPPPIVARVEAEAERLPAVEPKVEVVLEPPPPEPIPPPLSLSEPESAPLSLPEPPPVAVNEPEPAPPPPPPPPPKKTFEAIWAGDADAALGARSRAPDSARPAHRVEPEFMAPPTETHPEPPPAPPPAPVIPPPLVPPEPEQEVEIFKSGVIDGMAYTLYTDGSIEAELAHGTVKFASIDELRAYLAARDS